MAPRLLGRIAMSRLIRVRVGRPPGLPTPAAKRLFISDDIAPDVDGFMAVGQAFGHVSLGEAEIVGLASPSRCQWVPLAMERIARWHGFPNIPTGGWFGDGGIYDDTQSITMCGADTWSGYTAFAQKVAENYLGDVTTANRADSLKVWRDVLAAQPDNSVTVVIIGFHTDLYDFLQTPTNWSGDGLPSGVALANAKVDRFVVGGTRVGGTPNFNFNQAPDYTDWVMENVGDGLTVDKPFVVMPNNNSEPDGVAANMQVGSDAVNQPVGQIVRYAMREFITDTDNFEAGHFAWDLMTVLAAVRGSDYGWDETRGTFSRGTTREIWTEGVSGPHIRLTNNQTFQWYIDRIDPLIFHPEAV